MTPLQVGSAHEIDSLAVCSVTCGYPCRVSPGFTGTVARKRTNARLSHLTALAVMIALVAAMFVSIGPARAATGDVSHTSGYCAQDGVGDAATFQVFTGTTFTADSAPTANTAGENEVTIEVPDDGGETVDGALAGGRDLDDDPHHIRVTCNAALAGLPVSVAPDVSDTAIVTAKTAALSVRVNDSDNVVEADQPDLTVTLRFSDIVQFTHDATLNADDNADNDVAVASSAMPATAADASADGTPGQLELLWIRVNGELDNPPDPAAGAWAGSEKATTLAIPAGAAPGSYTISAAVRYDPNTNGSVTDDHGDGDSADEDGTV